MHNTIAEHDIKKSAYLLAATLLLPSCCMSASAKTVETRGAQRYIRASWSVLPDEFNFHEIVYRTPYLNTTSSTNSHNTGPGSAGTGPVPAATPTATVTPEQTTRSAAVRSVSGISQSITWIRYSIADMHADFINNHQEEY